MAAKITFIFVLIYGIVKVVPLGRVGPYAIEIEKIETCENQGSGKVFFGTKISSAGRGKYLYKENFTLGLPIDKNSRHHIELQKWGNGGWRTYMEHTFKGCEEIWALCGESLKGMLKSAGATVEKCPVPAGSYKADGWLIELNVDKVIPVIEYAKYRGTIKWHYKKELVGCFMVYGETEPKLLGRFSKDEAADN